MPPAQARSAFSHLHTLAQAVSSPGNDVHPFKVSPSSTAESGWEPLGGMATLSLLPPGDSAGAALFCSFLMHLFKLPVDLRKGLLVHHFSVPHIGSWPQTLPIGCLRVDYTVNLQPVFFFCPLHGVLRVLEAQAAWEMHRPRI